MLHSGETHRLVSSNTVSLTFYIRILKAVITVRCNDRSRPSAAIDKCSRCVMFHYVCVVQMCMSIIFSPKSLLYIRCTSTFLLSNSYFFWNIHIDFQILCIIIAWLTFYLFIVVKILFRGIQLTHILQKKILRASFNYLLCFQYTRIHRCALMIFFYHLYPHFSLNSGTHEFLTFC